MKLLFLSFVLIAISPCITSNSFAQQKSDNANKYGAFWEQRVTLFDSLPTSESDIIFLGNSISNGGEWAELFNGDSRMKNRGISGDFSEGILDRLDGILKGRPNKIFLLLGTNDIARNIPVDTLLSNYEKIIQRVKLESPKTELLVQSVMPVNPDFNMFQGHMNADKIKSFNESLKVLAEANNLKFIDLYNPLLQKDTDKLDPNYTNDGLHLLADGYLKWADIIRPYIYGSSCCDNACKCSK